MHTVWCTGSVCVCVCTHRMVYVECSASVCPCGDKCSNQCIQRHQSTVKFDKFLTHNRGYGVKTINAIQSGTSRPPVDYFVPNFTLPHMSPVGAKNLKITTHSSPPMAVSDLNTVSVMWISKNLGWTMHPSSLTA